MRTGDDPSGTGPAGTDSIGAGPRWVAPRAAPILASVAITALAGTLLVVAVIGFRGGLDDAAAADDLESVVVRFIASVVLGLGSLAFLAWGAGRIPAAIVQRIVVDSAGIRVRSTAGSVELGWGDIRSVRLLAVTGHALGHRSRALPASVNRRAVTRLEFTLRDGDDLEFAQPALERLRLSRARGGGSDGYTHAIPVLAGAFAPSLEIGDYAPGLQRVLEAHGGAAYAGAELRGP